jgi:hypothetical protein
MRIPIFGVLCGCLCAGLMTGCGGEPAPVAVPAEVPVSTSRVDAVKTAPEPDRTGARPVKAVPAY